MLPRNWKTFETKRLELMRSEREFNAVHLDDEDDAEEAQHEADEIGDELYLREHSEEIDPIDMDEQDRRAASEERIENHRRER